MTSLIEALGQRTAALHRRAEKSGVIAALLRGTASLTGYVRLQECLLPAYETMEAVLSDQRDHPVLGRLARPEVFRASRLRADIERLSIHEGLEPLPLPAEAIDYASRIQEAARGTGIRLIAHAYVRYLGDLSGGQILKKRLTRTFGLDRDALGFYDFPEIPDIAAYKEAYREALNFTALHLDSVEPILREAESAFEQNIAISEAVSALTGDSPAH